MLENIAVILGSSLGGFVITALVGLGVERLFPLNQDLERSGVRFGAVYAILLWFLLLGTAPIFGAVAAFITSTLGGSLISLPDTGLWLPASIAIYLFAAELLEYWLHRAMHSFPLLWRIHSFHHSEESFNIFTEWRDWFFAGRPLKGLILYTPLGLLFHASSSILAAIVIIRFFGNLLMHLDVRIELGRFSLWFMNPQFHRIHHSTRQEHMDKNFSCALPIMDVIFGTAWKPRKGEFPATGMTPRKVPNGLFEALMWPVTLTDR